MSRFKVGDAVRLWKPRHAEHGSVGVVSEVITIEEYYAPYRADPSRGPHAYKCANGWKWPRAGWGAIGGHLPDAMVVSEETYQRALARYAREHYWSVE